MAHPDALMQGDSALRKIEKAATVEQATISYDNRELLRLVQANVGRGSTVGCDRAASTHADANAQVQHAEISSDCKAVQGEHEECLSDMKK
eukprot:255495-Hanusia_phi.AAC.1